METVRSQARKRTHLVDRACTLNCSRSLPQRSPEAAARVGDWGGCPSNCSDHRRALSGTSAMRSIRFRRKNARSLSFGSSSSSMPERPRACWVSVDRPARCALRAPYENLRRGWTPVPYADHISATRIEELLAGGVPQSEAEQRLQEIAGELRKGSIDAPAPLRRRVESFTLAPQQRNSSARRLVLVAAAVIAVAGVTTFVRLTGNESLVDRRAQPHIPSGRPSDGPTLFEPHVPGSQTLPNGHARHISIDMIIGVRNRHQLLFVSRQAKTTTREFGGIAVGEESNRDPTGLRASLRLRIPVDNLQKAVFKISQSGTGKTRAP